MPLFTPPASDDTPRLEESTRGSAARLFRYFPTHRRGLNLYKYADGSYVLDVDPADPSTPVITYYGGHVYTVDTAEAAALTAAGYGAWVSNAASVTEPETPRPMTFDATGRML